MLSLRVASAAFAVGFPSAMLMSGGRLVHASSASSHPAALSPDEFREFKLLWSKEETHDTRRFRFQLPSEQHTLGLHICSCMAVKAQVDGETVIRPYTPVSRPDTLGYFDLVIKRYDQGKMSKHLHSMRPGDTLLCKGPFAKLEYRPNMVKHIGMLAGGTGLTPMLQLLQEIADNPEDKTEVDFIFANKSPRDIILHEELAAMNRKNPNIRVHFCVDEPGTEPWHAHVGHIDENLIKQHMPKPESGKDALILVCGPPPFMKAMSGDKAEDKTQGPLSGLLAKLGYKQEQVYKF